VRRRLRGRGRLIAAALVAVIAAVGVVGVVTDTPLEIRARQQLGLDAPCLPETEDSPGWREEEDLPAARDELRAAALDGHIYISGGTARLREYGKPSRIRGVRELVRAESVDDMLRFDPDTGRYERLEPMPERLNHHTMAAWGGKIYVVGGMGDLLFGADPRDDAFVYDPQTDSWNDLPPMPTPRGAAASAVIGDTLYVAGGMTHNGRLSNALEAFDFRTERWRRLADMPTPREHTIGAAVDGSMYVAGGRTLESDSIHAFERYDPETDTWTRLPQLPQDAGSLEAASVDGYFLAVAGDDDREGWVTGKVQRYDPAANEWTQLPEMRTKRHGMAAAVADGRLWVFGGSPCARFAASDIVESFDLDLVSDEETMTSAAKSRIWKAGSASRGS
jgi:N-acetylneuraminic acid mutarotase